MYYAKVLVAMDGEVLHMEIVAEYRSNSKKFKRFQDFKTFVFDRTCEEGWHMSDVHFIWEQRDNNGKLI